VWSSGALNPPIKSIAVDISFEYFSNPEYMEETGPAPFVDDAGLVAFHKFL
jgi:hypothetical protein